MWGYFSHFVKRFFNSSENRGRFGENIAVNFLLQKGYKIIRRNWHSGKAEIDVVAFDTNAKSVVFVEVKLRSASADIPGYYAVNARKKKLLRVACMSFVRSFLKQDASFRFDIIEIRTDPLNPSVVQDIYHFENVPLF